MKTIYIISIRLLQISFAFWLLETIFFIAIYGWHMSAINQAEAICDNIFVWGVRIGVAGYVWCVVSIVEAVMEADDFEPRKPFNP